MNRPNDVYFLSHGIRQWYVGCWATPQMRASERQVFDAMMEEKMALLEVGPALNEHPVC